MCKYRVYVTVYMISGFCLEPILRRIQYYVNLEKLLQGSKICHRLVLREDCDDKPNIFGRPHRRLGPIQGFVTRSLTHSQVRE